MTDTDQPPVHGCTIDGQPAMPILISEHTELVARAERAEAQAATYRAQLLKEQQRLTRVRDALRRWAPHKLPADATDDTALTEPDIDRMMGAGVPVQIVTKPPDTHAATPDRLAESGVHTPGCDCGHDGTTPATLADTACDAYRLPTTQAESGVCGRCGMYDYKHHAAWTPPPPGSTREQLPDHLLDLIRPHLRGYTSTACQTADYLTQAATDHPEHAAELGEWRRRMGERCRRNQKYTGEICPHHPTKEA